MQNFYQKWYGKKQEQVLEKVILSTLISKDSEKLTVNNIHFEEKWRNSF